jgi:phosphatidyl-myo-inositol dimannoside synthase
LNPRGGGVAAVARLMWRTFEDRWPGGCRLVTLVDDEAAEASLHSSTPTRMRFGARLAGAQASRACDWIMYSHLSLAKVQAFVPGAVRVPYAVFIHGIEAWRELPETQKAVLREARLRVANSSFTARRVMAMHPDIGPVVPCLLALPPGEFADHGAGPKAPRDESPTAIIVARMSADERYKGHDELLEAWPDVRGAVPGARLVVVGDGDDLGRLKEKAIALGLEDAVVFTGFVSQRELEQLYRRARLFAMPSRGEGFGLVYLEAMLHGLPCIGATEDAAPEVIDHGETGFVVSQSDRPALVASVSRLLTDAELQRRMGANAERQVRSRFGYERFASMLVERLAEAFGDVPAMNRVAM